MKEKKESFHNHTSTKTNKPETIKKNVNSSYTKNSQSTKNTSIPNKKNSNVVINTFFQDQIKKTHEYINDIKKLKNFFLEKDLNENPEIKKLEYELKDLLKSLERHLYLNNLDNYNQIKKDFALKIHEALLKKIHLENKILKQHLFDNKKLIEKNDLFQDSIYDILELSTKQSEQLIEHINNTNETIKSFENQIQNNDNSNTANKDRKFDLTSLVDEITSKLKDTEKNTSDENIINNLQDIINKLSQLEKKGTTQDAIDKEKLFNLIKKNIANNINKVHERAEEKFIKKLHEYHTKAEMNHEDINKYKQQFSDEVVNDIESIKENIEILLNQAEKIGVDVEDEKELFKKLDSVDNNVDAIGKYLITKFHGQYTSSLPLKRNLQNNILINIEEPLSIGEIVQNTLSKLVKNKRVKQFLYIMILIVIIPYIVSLLHNAINFLKDYNKDEKKIVQVIDTIDTQTNELLKKIDFYNMQTPIDKYQSIKIFTIYFEGGEDNIIIDSDNKLINKLKNLQIDKKYIIKIRSFANNQPMQDSKDFGFNLQLANSRLLATKKKIIEEIDKNITYKFDSSYEVIEAKKDIPNQGKYSEIKFFKID